jgi:hypothetical protein
MGHHHLCACAFASGVIILFGKFAAQFGLSRALLVLTCGFWAVAFLVTPLYLVYPKDAARLLDQMQETRNLITG